MFLGKHCFWFEWKLFFRCTVKFSLICSKNISYLWWILGLPCLVSLLTFKGIADIFFSHFICWLLFKFFYFMFFPFQKHIFWYVLGFYFNFSVFWRYISPSVFIPRISIYGLDFLRQLRVTWYCIWLRLALLW